MRRISGGRPMLVGALLSSLVLIANPLTASASITYAGIVNNIVSSDGFHGSWRGCVTPVAGPNDMADQQNKGGWSVLAWMYRATEPVYDDSDVYDWYEVEVQLSWSTTRDGCNDSRGYLVVAPNGGTITNKYIKSYVSSPSKSGSKCTTVNWSLGTSYGYISSGISVPIRICSGHTVTRELNSSTGWRWTTPDIPGTQKWSEVIEVKVPEGKSPGFEIKVIYPSYSLSYDYDQLRAEYTRSWREYSMNLTRTSP